MLQWHTGVYEETFYANSKIDQTMQNIKNFIVGNSCLQEMVNCSNYPEDTVQILESPRLSSRVDSTVLGVLAGCKESQFYSLPFGQAVASMF